MITLHHLEFSRSTRVLWLLEELSLDYNLIRYERAVGAPAPASLKTIHPLGTSPVIVDGGMTLAESSAILRYIDREYGASRFTPTETARRGIHDEWLDYVEGSLALPILVTLIGGGGMPERMAVRVAKMLDGNLHHVAQALTRTPYLMGDQLTLADMQMSYLVAVAAAAGMTRSYPAIDRYLSTLMALPALQKAIEKGGPMTL